MAEDAVFLTPNSHQAMPSRLNNLGNSLFRRFQQCGDLNDLNKSVLIREDVVNLTPPGHPKMPSRWNNLGNSLITRFRCLGDYSAWEKGISCYTSAAHSVSGPAHIRFHAASVWATLAKTGAHPSLLDAYQVALELLPELAWLGLSIIDRQYHLLKAGKIVRDAAAAAITACQPEKAVEWLEQGRSVIWGQLLNLRSPVDVLMNRHPQLATRLLSLSAQLDGSTTRGSHTETFMYGTHESLQSVANKAHQNAYDRTELLKQIRELEGFSQFLLPRSISELSHAAQQGPVVMLNLNEDRCDALILIPGLYDEVMHTPLPVFRPENAEVLAQSLSDLVGRSERLTGQLEGARMPEDELGHNLSELWFGVVKPVLDSLGMTVSNFISANRHSLSMLSESTQSPTPTYLVVSDRFFNLSAHSCCWPLWKK
jgi:hypothetical protein